MFEFDFLLLGSWFCIFTILAILTTLIADTFVEFRKAKLLETLVSQVKSRVTEDLKEDYENISEWVSEARKLSLALELIKEELEVLAEEKRKLLNLRRDKLGRFTKG